MSEFCKVMKYMTLHDITWKNDEKIWVNFVCKVMEYWHEKMMKKVKSKKQDLNCNGSVNKKKLDTDWTPTN